MWEQKKKARDATKMTRAKEQATCKMKWKKLLHHDEQELLCLWEGCHWDDNKGGWLDLKLCAKARREGVEYIRRHKMYTRSLPEGCLRETETAPIKTRWAETDKGQPGKLNVRARWVAKEYTELYASTPPLEALKEVLSEIATGQGKGRGTG